ncbi:NAD-dependent epimerase/dehydratase [Dillenia turbinata]|uniref:NAD-dependent epimerase/dehydratase n=1 Tax=Dillenia turbinata TaxID=194707 RepID=A0AAN8VF30_9MAGN
MNTGEAKVVAVTGASGYIASWLIKLLLDRGYTVRASVRDPGDAKKSKHLLELDGAEERLNLFKADLLEEGCFDSLVEGCDGVFHTASPVLLSVSDPQAELIDPAVKGTINVLASCAKAPSIKRVVITSSLSSVFVSRKPLTADVALDESWFSDPVYCEEIKNWYALSKTLAEKAAWEFAKENCIDLVVLHPGFVIGPILQPTLNLSMEMILDIAKGVQPLLGPVYRFVDVRDVALAHIKAFEIPSASGRYFLAERAAHVSEVQNILHQHYPTFVPLEICENIKPSGPKFTVSKDKAESLGIGFIPLDVSLKDTIECLREKKLISF